jgi:uncharacterized phage-like protein YoqJ
MITSPERLSIAVTGHRPGDLVHAGKSVDVAGLARLFITRAVARSAGQGRGLRIITGGALGVDQAVAEAAHEARDRGADLVSRIVLPFPVAIMANRWKGTDHARLLGLVESADEVPEPLSDRYGVWFYQKRNIVMIDAASEVAAFWTGKREGGTFNAIRYALLEADPPRPVWNVLADFRQVHAGDLSD